MDAPMWFGIAMVGAIGAIAVFRGRFLVDMWRKQKDGTVDPNDDWDPFK